MARSDLYAQPERVVKLLMIVGGGVSEGDYVNKAWAENGYVQVLASNIASAKVRVTADPLFDCAGLIGKVFDDKNRNGYQDKGRTRSGQCAPCNGTRLLVTTDNMGATMWLARPFPIRTGAPISS